MRGNLIRMRSRGHKGHRVYEIIVVSKGKRQRSAFIEKLGNYTPDIAARSIFLDVERLGYWLNHGAILKGSLINILKYFSH